MASNSNIATFIFNDEELVLFPGSRFSKQELKTRLKEMGINDNNSQDREYLKNLYDLAMKDYKNRASIIRRIKKDTEIINSRIYQSQKRSIPSSNMDNPNELEQKKLMNISYDVDKIYQNAKNKYYSNNKISITLGIIMILLIKIIMIVIIIIIIEMIRILNIINKMRQIIIIIIIIIFRISKMKIIINNMKKLILI